MRPVTQRDFETRAFHKVSIADEYGWQIGALAAASAPARALLRAIRTLALFMERSRQRRDLAKLDDHLLRDIGVTRYDAKIESRKRFWQ